MRYNPFRYPFVVPILYAISNIWGQERCLVLRVVPTAPVTPTHRSKASGGAGLGVPSSRGLQAALGAIDKQWQRYTNVHLFTQYLEP